jgi:phosphonate transport system substrate-binding protein
MAKLSRRLFILQMLLTLAACAKEKKSQEIVLITGVISYGEGQKTLAKFERFRKYLGEKTRTVIQLEPAFNENLAMQNIQHLAWALVFAPPGLAAFAKANYQYVPIFPLQIDVNTRSIFIVRKDSPLQQLKDLQGKVVALGILGSAAGYYFPLYNLYGLTLASILFAPTTKTILEWVAQGKAAAGAMSLNDFNSLKTQLSNVEFRILFTDPQSVPTGAVLISPNIEANRQELIRNYMKEAPLSVIQEVGYVPNGDVPDYQYMISVVKRVTSVATRLQEKPARIF